MESLEIPAPAVPEGKGEAEGEDGMAVGSREESMERRMACWIWSSSRLREEPRTVTSSSSSDEM
jgi:hypothetical protein